jgi:hypothetical protein
MLKIKPEQPTDGIQSGIGNGLDERLRDGNIEEWTVSQCIDKDSSLAFLFLFSKNELKQRLGPKQPR